MGVYGPSELIFKMTLGAFMPREMGNYTYCEGKVAANMPAATKAECQNACIKDKTCTTVLWANDAEEPIPVDSEVKAKCVTLSASAGCNGEELQVDRVGKLTLDGAKYSIWTQGTSDLMSALRDVPPPPPVPVPESPPVDVENKGKEEEMQARAEGLEKGGQKKEKEEEKDGQDDEDEKDGQKKNKKKKKNASFLETGTPPPPSKKGAQSKAGKGSER